MGLLGASLNFSVHQKNESFLMKKSLVLRLAAIPCFVLATAGAAHAELPAAVSTAITAYQTDALAAIALVMAAGVTIWGLMKLASKLGWR